MSTRVRLAEPSDAADIVSIYGPYCDSAIVSFEVVAPTLDQMRERISSVTAAYPWLVAETEGKVVGYVYASRHHERAAYRWSVDVAVYIAPSRQRAGVGRVLYEALFTILRAQGFFKAFAGITLPNPASIGLHESLGFRPAGLLRGVGHKFGKWLDVGWWQLDLQVERDAPSDPVPFRFFRSDPAVLASLAEGSSRLANQLRLPR